MYKPFNYEELNIDTSLYVPNTLYFHSRSFKYWCRSLFDRIRSVIDIEGLPDEISKANGAVNLIYYVLIFNGFIAFTNKIENRGIIALPCTLSGKSLYYAPNMALIANPALKTSYELEIGKECELLKLTNDYHGLYDIICRYAEKLSNIDNAIDMAINNSKLSYAGYAKNKAAAEALKLIMDKVNSGEPAIFMKNQGKNPGILPDIKQGTGDSESPFKFLPVLDVKNNYILNELLADQQTLLNNFDTEIGIPTVKDKKERMLTDEINTPIIDSQARALNWIENLNESAAKINSLYNLNISAKLHFDEYILNESQEVGDADA